jgi:hypothetical protein
MSEKKRVIRTEPLRDDEGRPVTLFGLPVALSPDIEPTPGIVMGSTVTEADAREVLAILARHPKGDDGGPCVWCGQLVCAQFCGPWLAPPREKGKP